MAETALDLLRRLTEYQERRKHVFRSMGAADWFVRQHKAALIEAGALVMLTGQWHVHEELFDAVVMRVGMDAAKRHTAAK